MVNRRTYLTTIGIAGTTMVAGCLGDTDDDTSDEPTTDDSDDEPDDTESESDETTDEHETETDADTDTDDSTDDDTTDELEETHTITIYGTPELREIEEQLEATLHEAGLPEAIAVTIEAGPHDSEERSEFAASHLEAATTDVELFLLDTNALRPQITAETLLPLEEHLSAATVETITDDYVEPVVEAASSLEGTLYTVPITADVSTIFYRRDLVEAAGYDPVAENWATEPLHWEAFAEMVATVQDEHDLEYGMTFPAAVSEELARSFTEWITGWGGGIVDDHADLFGPVGERTFAVDEPPVHDALRMLRTFIYGPDHDDTLEAYPQLTALEVLGWHEDDALSRFLAGDAVCHRNWSSAIALGEAEFGDDLGVMAMPYAVTDADATVSGAGGSASGLDCWHVVATPTLEGEGHTAAVAVLEALTDDAVATLLWRELDWLAPNPALIDAIESETDRAEHHLETLRVAATNAVSEPVTTVWPDQSTVIAQEVHDALTGAKSVEQSMADLEAGMKMLEQQ